VLVPVGGRRALSRQPAPETSPLRVAVYRVVLAHRNWQIERDIESGR